MAHGVVFVILLISGMVTSLQDHAQNKDYEYNDDYYDYPEPISNSKEIQEEKDIQSVPVKNLKTVTSKDPSILKMKRDREELSTEKPIARYEVTELVIDIPEVNTRRVPIITNFTVTRPLNFAGVSNNKTNNVGSNVKDEGDEIINSILIPAKSLVDKNNEEENKGGSHEFSTKEDEKFYFSDLSPKNSFEKEFEKEFRTDEDDLDDFEVKEESKPIKGFKDHFHNFRKNVVNEFKNVINKHKDGIHDSLHKIVNGPISFFSKLHKKSTDLVHKLHNAVSRHKHHDQGDDDGDYGFEDNE